MGQIEHRINTDGSVVSIHRIVVHRFRLGDVEDPDLYAADPILNWEKSDQGKFVMENSITTPKWYRQISFETMGWEFAIVAELTSKKLTEFYLRWGE